MFVLPDPGAVLAAALPDALLRPLPSGGTWCAQPGRSRASWVFFRSSRDSSLRLHKTRVSRSRLFLSPGEWTPVWARGGEEQVWTLRSGGGRGVGSQKQGTLVLPPGSRVCAPDVACRQSTAPFLKRKSDTGAGGGRCRDGAGSAWMPLPSLCSRPAREGRPDLGGASRLDPALNNQCPANSRGLGATCSGNLFSSAPPKETTPLSLSPSRLGGTFVKITARVRSLSSSEAWPGPALGARREGGI